MGGVRVNVGGRRARGIDECLILWILKQILLS